MQHFEELLVLNCILTAKIKKIGGYKNCVVSEMG